MDAVFESQERRIGAPHYGNFTWEREDEMVEDLNAVHFTVMPLIRVLLKRSLSLPISMTDKAFEGIRLGLSAIARIDVHLRYTTIVAADVFEPLSKNQINVDMVIQNISTDGKKTDITFTTKRQDSKNAISLIENNKNIKYEKIYMNDKVSKISIVGAGMVATPGITFKMFRALADENINMLAISTSEIKISVVIDEKLTIDAVKKLHKTFNLD
mgnify:CR=1 FL=1